MNGVDPVNVGCKAPLADEVLPSSGVEQVVQKALQDKQLSSVIGSRQITCETDLGYSIPKVIGVFLMLVFIIMPIWLVLGLILYPITKILLISNIASKDGIVGSIHFFAKEIFSLFAVAAKFPSAYFKTHEVECKDKSTTPILLIHGYLHNNSAWGTYLDKLQDRGSVYSINLGSLFLPIQEYAKKVKEKADEIFEKTGNPNLILIGHSMGGLVASLYATDYAKPKTVKQIFTLGTPFHGCSRIVAPFIMGPNGRQMLPSSTFLQKLRGALLQKVQEDDIQFYNTTSRADIQVPRDSGFLVEEEQNRQVFPHCHVNLLSSKDVSEWVCSRLALS